jgi:Zn-finger nucleic acid-binding protein
MNCPKCEGSELQSVSVPLEDRSVPGPKKGEFLLEIDRCPECGGVWFDDAELDKYLDARMKVPGLPPPEPAKAAALDAKRGNCPRCAVLLDRRPARSNPRVTVDACVQCAGVWVDGAELSDASGTGVPFADRMKAMFGDLKP